MRWPLTWVLLAALTGLSSSVVLSSWLRWPRQWFVLGYAAAAGLFLGWFFRVAQVQPIVQLRRRWQGGLLGGLVLGAILAHGVAGQPRSARPDGADLGWALVWLGGVYGSLDALLLSVVPVLSVYGNRPAEVLRQAGARARWGALALVASLGITTAYHVGFEEFRSSAVAQPLLGNGLLTTGYLLTGNPLTPVLGHVIMHGAAVLHGMGTTAQLPPHY